MELGPHGIGPTRRRSKDRARARAEMELGLHGIGPTRRRSTCERDRAREGRRKQRDIASEESKAKEKRV